MSRKKAGVCACGHEIVHWHDELGRCTYGTGMHGEPMGFRCPCQRKVKAATRAVTVNGDAVLGALDAVISALGVLRAELVRGKGSKGGHVMPSILRDESGGAGAKPRARANGASIGRVTPSFPNGGEGPALNRGERLILTAIAQRSAGVTSEGIAVLTGYKATSRRTYLQELKSRKLIFTEGGRFFATDEGRAVLGAFEQLPVGKALVDHWLERLPEGESTVFSAIISAEDGSMTAGGISRETIEAVTGYKATSVRTYVQKLIARELVTRPGPGMVRLSPELES